MAGYAYAAYAPLKISTVVEETAAASFRLGGDGDKARRERVRKAVWIVVRARGLVDPEAVTSHGLSEAAIAFLRDFDTGFRARRLRFVTRRLTGMKTASEAERAARDETRKQLDDMLTRHQSREPSVTDETTRRILADVEARPEAALAALARLLDLRALDDETDERLAEAFGALPKAARRPLLLTYLGYPFYDVATLPLLQGEGLDEFDPIKVDRISPDDAVAIRKGGTEATLKGIQFNSFGAFFSRAYRENDYLWGRLHGADRMIDITLSALPDEARLTDESVKALKREAFRAILAEERERLTAIPTLFDQLDREIG